MSRVDLGKLEDGDTETDDEEAHNKGYYLLYRRLEPLEEDDGGDN